MLKIEQIYLAVCTGNELMITIITLQCWCCLGAIIAYNAFQHFHSPQLGIPDAPIPVNLQVKIKLYVFMSSNFKLSLVKAWADKMTERYWQAKELTNHLAKRVTSLFFMIFLATLVASGE